jgi:ribose/xylose/arabinose/galactoside ABC-type transport system permease subunit
VAYHRDVEPALLAGLHTARPHGLSLLGVPFWVQPVFNGGVPLVAVLVARAEARKVRVGE